MDENFLLMFRYDISPFSAFDHSDFLRGSKISVLISFCNHRDLTLDSIEDVHATIDTNASLSIQNWYFLATRTEPRKSALGSYWVKLK